MDRVLIRQWKNKGATCGVSQSTGGEADEKQWSSEALKSNVPVKNQAASTPYAQTTLWLPLPMGGYSDVKEVQRGEIEEHRVGKECRL